jgi:hypothetical protein
LHLVAIVARRGCNFRYRINPVTNPNPHRLISHTTAPFVTRLEVFTAVVMKNGMLLRVALVRNDVSEELSASIIRVTRIDKLGTMLAVTSNGSVASYC